MRTANLDVEQILLVQAQLHLLLDELLAELEISYQVHLVQQPVEISVRRHF